MTDYSLADKADAVTAHFGGRDLIFKLDRDKIPYIEDHLGEPLQVRWRKIMAGTARVAEVQEVVELAAPAGLGIKQPKDDIEVFRIKMARMGGAIPQSGRTRTWVGKVFAENPPARYAVLAQGIIAACLTGIPPGPAAHFDEREKADEEPADD
ncbi:MAG: hypothetical protein J0J10_09480 [Bosea sp.]|uniref:hypothetical protein n=1 Tax=Bosea sp. (in: a-proteobacteria) TaxID=1871050 RepID=UPI001ACC16F6|nr:hypothetical protein [Bosea sp. (in: a-proteobacteria)]MBN9468989.1 hypothetical protein [Bosea sp. (in: a-proteobacteria)]